MGGLTVLSALAARLPQERFVYLGDTARLPYGTKSAETVEAYALQATRLLIEEGVKMVVIACNTASAVALPPLDRDARPRAGDRRDRAGRAGGRRRHPQRPYRRHRHRGHGERRRLSPRHPCAPGARCSVVQQPCQVFVALAEEGWTHSDVTVAAA